MNLTTTPGYKLASFHDSAKEIAHVDKDGTFHCADMAGFVAWVGMIIAERDAWRAEVERLRETKP